MRNLIFLLKAVQIRLSNFDISAELLLHGFHDHSVNTKSPAVDSINSVNTMNSLPMNETGQTLKKDLDSLENH